MFSPCLPPSPPCPLSIPPPSQSESCLHGIQLSKFPSIPKFQFKKKKPKTSFQINNYRNTIETTPAISSKNTPKNPIKSNQIQSNQSISSKESIESKWWRKWYLYRALRSRALRGSGRRRWGPWRRLTGRLSRCWPRRRRRLAGPAWPASNPPHFLLLSSLRLDPKRRPILSVASMIDYIIISIISTFQHFNISTFQHIDYNYLYQLVFSLALFFLLHIDLFSV